MKSKTNMTKAELVEYIEIQEAEAQLAQEELNAEIEDAKLKNKETTEAISTQKSEIEELKTMMLQMQANQSNNVKSNHRDEEDTILVKSNLIEGVTLMIDKETPFRFNKFGRAEAMSVKDIHSLLKFNNNRTLFIDGLIMFEEEDNYDRFNIKPRRLLTDEYVTSLFEMSPHEFREELDIATLNKTNLITQHHIVYKSGLLYQTGKIKGVSGLMMDEFESYFGVSIRNLNIHLLLDE